MQFITYALEKPGQPVCKWRIEEEPICEDPRSYLLNAVTEGPPFPRVIGLGTITLVGRWFICARVGGIRFQTIYEARLYFTRHIVELLK